jgi:hypothetical protein
VTENSLVGTVRDDILHHHAYIALFGQHESFVLDAELTQSTGTFQAHHKISGKSQNRNHMQQAFKRRIMQLQLNETLLSAATNRVMKRAVLGHGVSRLNLSNPSSIQNQNRASQAFLSIRLKNSAPMNIKRSSLRWFLSFLLLQLTTRLFLRYLS